MDRVNSEGLPRHQLAWALSRRDKVMEARQRDSCLLCRQGPVNEAGLCLMCTLLLTDEEQSLMERWRAGVGP